MSRARALTPWFAGTVKPARPGVYQRRGGNNAHTYSLWDGARWCFSAERADEAALNIGWPSLAQHKPWRGLARAGAQQQAVQP